MEYLYILVPVGAVAGIYLIRKLREFQWGWVKNTSTLKGKLYIITGANTGLGYETAKALAKRDAKVILACRSEERAAAAIAKIRRDTAQGELISISLDLSSFDSIRRFATKIIKEYPEFDCIVNNAGLAVKTQQFTKENFEVHFGVNQLGHFLLIDLLKDNITRNKSRIVVVSSKLHERGKIDLDNLGKYNDTERVSRSNPYYNNSKLANFYFARELYKKGFDCHVLCPGLCNTDFFRDYNPKWYHYILFSPIVLFYLRSSKQGAQNIIHCATDNINTEAENPSTGYFVTNLKQTKSKVSFDDKISKDLWDISSKMCTKDN